MLGIFSHAHLVLYVSVIYNHNRSVTTYPRIRTTSSGLGFIIKSVPSRLKVIKHTSFTTKLQSCVYGGDDPLCETTDHCRATVVYTDTHKQQQHKNTSHPKCTTTVTNVGTLCKCKSKQMQISLSRIWSEHLSCLNLEIYWICLKTKLKTESSLLLLLLLFLEDSNVFRW